jgi:hypothetical protein
MTMTNTKQTQTQTFGARTPATMSPAVAQMRVTRDLHDAEARSMKR